MPVPRVLHLGGADGPLGVELLRDGARGRPRLPQRAAAGLRGRARAARGDRRRRSSTSWPTCMPSTPPRSASRASAGRPASSSASCAAGRSSGRPPRPRELPALDALRDELVRTLPPQRAAAIVHGDYRLDNTILHPTAPGRIVAVLDWEMSTLGDPLTDLGTLLAYWSEEADDDVLAAARVMAPVTAAEGFPDARRRSSAATRRGRASTSPTSSGTRRSPSSSSPSSARGSPRAPRAARCSAPASTRRSGSSRRSSRPAGSCSARG